MVALSTSENPWSFSFFAAEFMISAGVMCGKFTSKATFWAGTSAFVEASHTSIGARKSPDAIAVCDIIDRWSPVAQASLPNRSYGDGFLVDAIVELGQTRNRLDSSSENRGQKEFNNCRSKVRRQGD